MGRSKLILTQGDIQRIVKGATKAGLVVARLEVEGAKVVLVVMEDGKERKEVINPLHSAPSFWSGRKGRK